MPTMTMIATAIGLLIAVPHIMIGIGTNTALYYKGEYSVNTHWSDRIAIDNEAYIQKMNFLSDRNNGRFIVDSELKTEFDIRQSTNSTNGTIPTGIGECDINSSEEQCNGNGDCKLENGVGMCDCDAEYDTEDDEDPCGYHRRGKWLTFLLSFIGFGSPYFYLSQGASNYITVGIINAVLTPGGVVLIVVGAFTTYCLVGIPIIFIGLLCIVANVAWGFANVIMAGASLHMLARDGNGVKVGDFFA